jgi:hypothetical protein
MDQDTLQEIIQLVEKWRAGAAAEPYATERKYKETYRGMDLAYGAVIRRLKAKLEPPAHPPV